MTTIVKKKGAVRGIRPEDESDNVSTTVSTAADSEAGSVVSGSVPGSPLGQQTSVRENLGTRGSAGATGLGTTTSFRSRPSVLTPDDELRMKIGIHSSDNAAKLNAKHGVEAKETAFKHVKSVVETNASGNYKHSMLKGVKPGYWETLLIKKVKEGEHLWVADLLQKTGKHVVNSPWGGQMARTVMIYAAQKKDLEMCRILARYGGKDLMQVQDIKKRSCLTYAAANNWDISKITAEGGVDCWNHTYNRMSAGKSVTEAAAQNILGNLDAESLGQAQRGSTTGRETVAQPQASFAGVGRSTSVQGA